jgi:EpsI family protein
MGTLIRSIALCATLIAASVLIARASASEVPQDRVSFAAFPMALGDWRGRAGAPLDVDTLAVLGVTDYLTRTYTANAAAANLYVGYWASQKQGDSIHSPLNCLPGAGWEPLSKTMLAVPVVDGDGLVPARSIAVNRYVVQKGLDRELVLYWYQSHGRVVANEYLSKMYLVADAIRTNRTDAALVRVIVHIGTQDGGETLAEREGVQFIASLFPILSTYLPS